MDGAAHSLREVLRELSGNYSPSLAPQGKVHAAHSPYSLPSPFDLPVASTSYLSPLPVRSTPTTPIPTTPAAVGSRRVAPDGEHHCTQCRASADMTQFPLRVTSLEPHNVCKLHGWYWTEDKVAGSWAPEWTVDLATVFGDMGRRNSGPGTHDVWVLEASEEISEMLIVTKFAMFGDWKTSQIWQRKSRTTKGPAPAPTSNYLVTPNDPTVDSPHKITLSIAHVAHLNKWIVQFKEAGTTQEALAAWRVSVTREDQVVGDSKVRRKRARDPAADGASKKPRKAVVKRIVPMLVPRPPVPINVVASPHFNTLPDPSPNLVPRAPKAKAIRPTLIVSTTPPAKRISPLPILDLPSYSLGTPPATDFFAVPHPVHEAQPLVPRYQPLSVFASTSANLLPYDPTRPMSLADLLASPFLGSPPLPTRVRRYSIGSDALGIIGDEEEGSEEDYDEEDLMPEEDEEDSEDEEDEDDEGGDWLTGFVKGQLNDYEEDVELGEEDIDELSSGGEGDF